MQHTLSVWHKKGGTVLLTIVQAINFHCLEILVLSPTGEDKVLGNVTLLLALGTRRYVSSTGESTKAACCLPTAVVWVFPGQ